MANELSINYPTGATLYALLFDATGQIWNGSVFAAPGSASWTDYDIAMTEVATATGIYRATMPAAAAGVYTFSVRKQAGANPAVGDIAVGSGKIEWSGTAEVAASDKTGFKLASDGLDAISTTAPAGVASNFREMMVQLWRRLFAKQTLTTTELITYADDGTTVLTTQTVSDDGTVQTIGAAS